jgi:GT2 family glycosyltransferase
VSVLIPTYKDALLLRQSLPIFLEHPPDDIEIVVVNNDPSQDVRAAVGSQRDDSRVRLVEMGWEAGFARAVNRGIRETSGEFVMLCNADLFPAPTYLAELLAFFEAHPAAGAAIGKLLRYDLETDRPTDVIDSAGLVLSRQRRFMPRGEGERDVGQFDEAPAGNAGTPRRPSPTTAEPRAGSDPADTSRRSGGSTRTSWRSPSSSA